VLRLVILRIKIRKILEMEKHLLQHADCHLMVCPPQYQAM